MRSELYQMALIFLGVVSAALLGAFIYREIYPEYKIYQDDFVQLEKFRSSYAAEPPPPFKPGIKQIVMEREDKGPPLIDRCTSCHAALEIPDYSPTQIEYDINGKMVVDENGWPVKIHNPNYVWGRLDQKIAELTDEKVNQQLKTEGKTAEVKRRLNEAEALKSLKTAQVGDQVYDLSKVLVMHPLIGNEKNPFEYHPVDQYGCTSCHNGNGRALTTDKAHGPVFDGSYQVEFQGYIPQFTEPDLKNDPLFAKEFNHKPGDELVFQTTPIFVGALIEAKCMQCHLSSSTSLQEAFNSTSKVTAAKKNRSETLTNSLNDDKQALISLLQMELKIKKLGFTKTLAELKKASEDYALPEKELDRMNGQIHFLNEAARNDEKEMPNEKLAEQRVENQINLRLEAILGSEKLVQAFKKEFPKNSQNQKELSNFLDAFLKKHQNDPQAKGSIFVKLAKVNLDKDLAIHFEETEASINKAVKNQNLISSMAWDVDLLTKHYQRGQQLYISQACYACHRIAGLARGGVGPELTLIGKGYPWYIKESIVWPQAVPGASMPNFRLDHEEIQDLMTFLLGQNGENKALSGTAYKSMVQSWETVLKQPWEKPITPVQARDLNYAMMVFATEGCSSCHRLKGFESNIGYRIEKEKKDKITFAERYKESEWFSNLFPEDILGSQIVAAIDKHAAEIDQHIVGDVREGSILEEINKRDPDNIESLYSPFRYALRAKNHHYKALAEAEKNPDKKEALLKELDGWKERVRRVLMVFVQEYGLGRLIGPRPNWSGIYRSDQWLMEHFHNPAGHSPRSIMPTFPFDDSKFLALTYMLDVLGKRNRDEDRAIWQHNGFNPQQAVQIHCAQCHGDFLHGNGPVAEWIYPIPKNLRNAEFMRNLTKERVIQSITHGVKGTPMPPWGEAAMDKPTADGIPVLSAYEIGLLADWLFSSLPGSTVIKGSKDVPKWEYSPEDALKDLQQEGHTLESGSQPSEIPKETSDSQNLKGPPDELAFLPNGSAYYADLTPKVYASESGREVSEIFDITPPPVPGADKHGYYIKKKYYTPQNIEAGKKFFEMNCAVCHGTEADGTGPRSEAMQEQKPRMLINLDWINTRDDLRLLRSIKFGVPGTAMTPWGDLTSALQRMQLVIFIRSLTLQHELSEQLSFALYQAFDAAAITIEDARVHEYARLHEIEKKLEDAQSKTALLSIQVKNGQPQAKEAVEAYQKQLQLVEEVRKQKIADRIFLDLKSYVQSEKSIYDSLGKELLTAQSDQKEFEQFVKLIKLHEGLYTLKDNQLNFTLEPAKEGEMTSLSRQIQQQVESKIDSLQKEKTIAEGKMASQTRTEELASLSSELQALNKLKIHLISGLEEAKRLLKKQSDLLKLIKV